METNDTVYSRFETARTELTPLQVATGPLFAGSFNIVQCRAEPWADAGDSHETLTGSP
ncbi:hypothetical protein [Natronorubrum sp. DTA7]|uniref:hypothetical protein n=1 Tax=Natronorubrum sp. DTA7 TaxID=3447016 RepID=UPI003F872867